MHDLINAAGRDAEALRQPVLSQAERRQKVLPQYLTRVHRGQALYGHRTLLMVIDNLDVVSIATFPAKTDPPLVVDANAMLPYSITCQLLEAVARRHAEVIERGSRVDLGKLAQRDSLNRMRQLADRLPVEEALRVLVPEAADHARILTRHVNSVNEQCQRERG